MKKSPRQYFKPENYDMRISADGQVELMVKGLKLPPPSKRISFRQKGIKLLSANITRNDKKGAATFIPTRINYLPTINEVRIHTEETLFPGHYEISIRYKLDSDKLSRIQSAPEQLPSIELMPQIDNPDARDDANFTLSYIDE